jgi:hypothetical protein
MAHNYNLTVPNKGAIKEYNPKNMNEPSRFAINIVLGLNAVGARLKI